jgi:diguanylate cyclase (GGDEF)-like protein
MEKSGRPGMSSDRKVLISALLIVVTSIGMVMMRLLSHFDGAGRYDTALVWMEVLACSIVIGVMAFAGPLALREMRDRRKTAASATEARRQVEKLFQMTDMLQSALDHADANAVLRATAEELLGGFGGALYIFNNSRDRLDLSTLWNWPQDRLPPDAVSPSHCWALKRGKTHLNHVGTGALRCEHHDPAIIVLEIPMMARGEVYGLLNVQADGEEAEERLAQVTQIAGAIADAMSLALSNIALREKLRTQALRDPLTGLYNRRYMEDALERYVSLAQRNGSAISAIMIDLDHFKRLNDEHGHALGDAVLREVAAAIVGSIRQCDVACRYGGEELVVLLPDCAVAEAVTKAEMLRARIESLSENHGMRISASFGVATLPETSEKAGDLIANADAALYRAKQEGRNRVIAAARRPGLQPGKPLSVAAE